MFKFINYCDARKGKITKKIFWCVKEYEYLGCLFYCVKARKNLTYSKYLWKKIPESLKYAYIEAYSGHALLTNFPREVLSEKKFKKEVRRMLTKQSRCDGRGSLKSLIKDRRNEYEESKGK